MSYRPSPEGEPRPAPPEPDVDNLGRRNVFESPERAPAPAPEPAPEPAPDYLTLAVKLSVLGWIALDVLSRVV